MRKIARNALNGFFGIALTLTTLGGAAFAQTTTEVSDLWHHGWDAALQINNEGETRIAVGVKKVQAVLVSRLNRDQFDLGFAFVRAAFYASESNQNADLNDRAIVELAKLSARFDAQPEIQIALDKVLKMVAHGNGNAEERWQIVMTIADLHGTKLAGESKWFYQAGIVLTRLHLANFKKDQDNIRKELQNLETLSKAAPTAAPSGMLGFINNLTSQALPSVLTNSEFLAIDNAFGNILGLIYA